MESRLDQQATLERLSAEGVAVAQGYGTWWQRTLTWGAVLACIAVLARLAPANPAVWWVLPLALLLADFLSGVVHWLFDTRIQPGPGLLGRAAINFLDHHVHPGRSAATGFAATSWRVALFVTAPLLAATLAVPAGAGQAWLLWLAVLSLVIAQAHKEAHKPRPVALVRWLQRWHLCLPPDAHRRHHRDHRRDYCVFTGWCNPLLDRFGFWDRLDRECQAGAVRARAGAPTRRWRCQAVSLSSRSRSPPN